MSDQKVECPYNSSHKIAAVKYIYHIMRCKDKLKVGHMFVHCQFNNLHIIKRQDLVDHYKICKDKHKKIELYKSLQGIRALKTEILRNEEQRLEQLDQQKIEEQNQIKKEEEQHKEEEEFKDGQENKDQQIEQNNKDKQIKKKQKDKLDQDQSQQEQKSLDKNIKYLFDCSVCSKNLKAYYELETRSPEIDKLLKKFQFLNMNETKTEHKQCDH